jgi:hypothetical protein
VDSANPLFSATKITGKGWVAEICIPLSQLRFLDKQVHTWGFNVSCWTARLRESSRLVHSSKTESGFVSRFADLEGIEGIEPKRAFELMPYGVARSDVYSRANNPFVPRRIASTRASMHGSVDVHAHRRSIPTSAR